MGLTTGIAVYGAVLSSALLGWNVYKHLTDRGKLAVHCYIGNIVSRGGPRDEKDYLIYSVTNVGRRPVLVTQVGGQHREKNFLIITDRLPKRLKPDDYLIEYTPDLTLLRDDLLCLWALDSRGRTHKVKKSVLKELINKGKDKTQAATQRGKA